MFSKLTFLITVVVLSFSFSKTYSQTDTTQYDLGRLKAKKDFIQSITIKRADLQRQPFASLSDAINVWFYGTYTNANTVVYVIDGNIINDINAYNINDIEEVTLVQTALNQVNGAGAGKQLILIKTRRNRSGKSGLEVAGQTNIVNMRNTTGDAVKSTDNFFHQYYLSAYKNTSDVNVGVSATYLRDISPFLKSNTENIATPLNLDRFNFNAYADIKLGAKNSINANATYAPQVTDLKYQSVVNSNTPYQSQLAVNDHIKQQLFNGGLALNSILAQGLQNKLSATYGHYQYNGNYNFNQMQGSDASGYQAGISSAINKGHDNITLIRDNLSYHKSVGDFSIAPSVDLSYRYTKSVVTSSSSYLTYYNNAGLPASATQTTDSITQKRKDWLLTPSLSVAYKNYLTVTGGVVAVLNSKKDMGLGNDADLKRIFPYASASLNFSALTGIKTVGIKLYGSYAKQNMLLQADGMHLNNLNETFNTSTTLSYSYLYSYSYTTVNYNPLKPFNFYMAGANFDISPLITVNYNYERGGMQVSVLVYTPQQDNSVAITEMFNDSKYTRNSIGINFNIINKATARFTTGLTTTNINQKINGTGFDASWGTKIWTGGWVNRLDVNNIFAGLDVLYQTGKGNALYTYASPYSSLYYQAVNSFSLQNIYFGYRLKNHLFKNLELFANGRNVWQNKKSNITDNRRFYGLGFKLGL
ncbi:hypothetical protein AAFN85_15875 [Mucilaginibacter sp. CAU 1740]|uniref:hypothetical protein n=1 Tax=Mucilaginibacter sp. CAU 1740 TaxID=3140365 RepID=UPI00325B1066